MNRYTKTYTAVTAAVLVTVGIIAHGVHTTDAVPLASTWLGALGVFLFPNANTPTKP